MAVSIFLMALSSSDEDTMKTRRRRRERQERLRPIEGKKEGRKEEKNSALRVRGLYFSLLGTLSLLDYALLLWCLLCLLTAKWLSDILQSIGLGCIIRWWLCVFGCVAVSVLFCT